MATEQLLEQLDTHENVPELERLQGQLLRCRILALQDIKQAHQLKDDILLASQARNHPLIGIDVFLVVAEGWVDPGILETCQTIISQAKAF